MANYEFDTSPQIYARVAGALLLVPIVAGGIGEAYIPATLIVSGDAAATAHSIQTSGLLFRVGFAFYLVEAVCDIALALLFYVLLSPVRRDLALLAVLFRLVSTSTFALAMLFYFASSIILSDSGYLEAFSADQIKSLAMLSIRIYGYGGGIYMLFHGIASILFGYLIFRSGYLPRITGALLALGGFGFVTRNFLLVLAPSYASNLLLLPAVLAGLVLTFWLIVKGVDVRKWEEVVTTRAVVEPGQ